MVQSLKDLSAFDGLVVDETDAVMAGQVDRHGIGVGEVKPDNA